MRLNGEQRMTADVGSDSSRWVAAVGIAVLIASIVVPLFPGSSGVLPLLVAVALLWWGGGSPFKRGFSLSGEWSRRFGWSLVALLAAIAWSFLYQAVAGRVAMLPPIDMSGNVEALRQPVGLIVSLVSGGLIMAVLEEIAFRLFLIERLGTLLGRGPHSTWLAVVLASVVFGATHHFTGAQSGRVLLTAGLGLVLGWLYVKLDRNLWGSIFVHSLYNVSFTLSIYYGLPVLT